MMVLRMMVYILLALLVASAMILAAKEQKAKES